MAKKRSQVGLLFLVVMVVLVFTACSNTNNSGSNLSPNSSGEPIDSASNVEDEKPYEGQKLVVGVWGGSYADTLKEHVVKPLEEKGASVELVLGGTGDRLAKMYAEKGNPSMDVAFLNLYESKQAIDDGVAQAVNTSIPNVTDLYPSAQTNGYGMTYMALGIVYNPAYVTEPIVEWEDLWNEELKGKVAFPTYPSFEGDSMVSVANIAFGLQPTDDQGSFDKLKELGSIPLSYSSLDELFLELKNGGVYAAPIFNSYAFEYINKGYEVEYVYPTNPGAIMAKDTIVIAEGTKYQQLAEEFVSLAVGVDTQTAFAEKLYFGPTNTQVKVEEDLASRIVYGEIAVNKLKVLDWDYILTKRSDWTQKWNTEILGN